jgi:hypothetical protein
MSSEEERERKIGRIQIQKDGKGGCGAVYLIYIYLLLCQPDNI